MEQHMNKSADCDFQITCLETGKPLLDLIGDQAELRMEPGSSITEFAGTIRGCQNEIHIGPGARITELRLEIDGDGNRIRIESDSEIRDCRIRIGGHMDRGDFRGNHNLVRIGPANSLRKTAVDFTGSSNVLETGDRVYIADGSQLFVNGFGCAIRIGDATSATNAYFHAEEIETSIEIGEDTMIAAYVAIWAGDIHPIFNSDSFQRLNNAKSIVVGKHVWLCSGAQLQKGARVGDNCIVGKHTTIMGPVNYDNSDVLAQDAIIYGMPAKVQKRGVAWSREMVYDVAGMEKYPDACSQSWFHKGHLYVRRANDLLADNHDPEARMIYLEAVRAYQEAINYKNDYIYAYCAIGVAYIHLAQIELFGGGYDTARVHLRSALSSFERALDQDPAHVDSIFYRDVVKGVLEQLERERADDEGQSGTRAGFGRAHAMLARIERHLLERDLESRELKTSLSLLDRVGDDVPGDSQLGLTREEVRARLRQLEPSFQAR